MDKKWLLLVPLLVLPLFLTCKPRRATLSDDSASEAAQTRAAATIQTFAMMATHVGLHENDDEGLQATAEIFYNRGMTTPLRYQALTTIVEQMQRFDWSSIKVGGAEKTRIDLVEDLALGSTAKECLLAERSDQRFQVCDDFESCKTALYSLTAIARWPLAKKLPLRDEVYDDMIWDRIKENRSDLVTWEEADRELERRRRLQLLEGEHFQRAFDVKLVEVEADINCFSPNSRRDLLQYHLDSIRTWQAYYSLTNVTRREFGVPKRFLLPDETLPVGDDRLRINPAATPDRSNRARLKASFYNLVSRAHGSFTCQQITNEADCQPRVGCTWLAQRAEGQTAHCQTKGDFTNDNNPFNLTAERVEELTTLALGEYLTRVTAQEASEVIQATTQWYSRIRQGGGNAPPRPNQPGTSSSPPGSPQPPPSPTTPPASEPTIDPQRVYDPRPVGDTRNLLVQLTSETITIPSIDRIWQNIEDRGQEFIDLPVARSLRALPGAAQSFAVNSTEKMTGYFTNIYLSNLSALYYLDRIIETPTAALAQDPPSREQRLRQEEQLCLRGRIGLGPEGAPSSQNLNQLMCEGTPRPLGQQNPCAWAESIVCKMREHRVARLGGRMPPIGSLPPKAGYAIISAAESELDGPWRREFKDYTILAFQMMEQEDQRLYLSKQRALFARLDQANKLGKIFLGVERACKSYAVDAAPPDEAEADASRRYETKCIEYMEPIGPNRPALYNKERDIAVHTPQFYSFAHQQDGYQERVTTIKERAADIQKNMTREGDRVVATQAQFVQLQSTMRSLAANFLPYECLNCNFNEGGPCSVRLEAGNPGASQSLLGCWDFVVNAQFLRWMFTSTSQNQEISQILSRNPNGSMRQFIDPQTGEIHLTNSADGRFPGICPAYGEPFPNFRTSIRSYLDAHWLHVQCQDSTVKFAAFSAELAIAAAGLWGARAIMLAASGALKARWAAMLAQGLTVPIFEQLAAKQVMRIGVAVGLSLFRRSVMAGLGFQRFHDERQGNFWASMAFEVGFLYTFMGVWEAVWPAWKAGGAALVSRVPIGWADRIAAIGVVHAPSIGLNVGLSYALPFFNRIYQAAEQRGGFSVIPDQQTLAQRLVFSTLFETVMGVMTNMHSEILTQARAMEGRGRALVPVVDGWVNSFDPQGVPPGYNSRQIPQNRGTAMIIDEAVAWENFYGSDGRLRDPTLILGNVKADQITPQFMARVRRYYEQAIPAGPAREKSLRELASWEWMSTDTHSRDYFFYLRAQQAPRTGTTWINPYEVLGVRDFASPTACNSAAVSMLEGMNADFQFLQQMSRNPSALANAGNQSRLHTLLHGSGQGAPPPPQGGYLVPNVNFSRLQEILYLKMWYVGAAHRAVGPTGAGMRSPAGVSFRDVINNSVHARRNIDMTRYRATTNYGGEQFNERTLASWLNSELYPNANLFTTGT